MSQLTFKERRFPNRPVNGAAVRRPRTAINPYIEVRGRRSAPSLITKGQDQNSLPEFRRCASAKVLLGFNHEEFELSNRSGFHGYCRCSLSPSGGGRARPRLCQGRFSERISLPALPPLGAPWGVDGPVSVCG